MKDWYHEGLSFKCTGCGGCCTGSPGYVWVSEKEMEELATFLKMTKGAFARRFTRRIGDRISLLEHPKNYDCVFLQEGKRCSVYAARPRQCKTFPWWPDHLKSKAAWKEAAKRCEGINHPDAKIVSYDEINKWKALEENDDS